MSHNKETPAAPDTPEAQSNKLNMNQFHNNIVALTVETGEKSILIKHTNELYDLLMDGFVENIQIAARNGYFTAYIALFNVNTVYRGKVLVVDLLFPSHKVVRKCRKHGITPVFERIQDTLHPFEVEYKVLNEEDEKKYHVGAIIAQWKPPPDDPSDSSDDTDDNDVEISETPETPMVVDEEDKNSLSTNRSLTDGEESQ